MIPYIEVQLCAWGRWAIKSCSRACGYPPVSPMFRDMKTSAVYGSREPFGVDEYVNETDLAVQRLGEEDRRLCVERYQVGGSADEIAARVGLSKRTLFRRIDALQVAVMEHLNVIAAESECSRGHHPVNRVA